MAALDPRLAFLASLLPQSAPQHAQHNGAISQVAGDIAQSPVTTAHQLMGIPVSADEEARAQRGSEAVLGGMQGGDVLAGMTPAINATADLAAGAGKVAYQGVKQGVKDTVEAAQAQPGGLQAGFIGTRTPEEIQAAKAAGEEPIIHNNSAGLPPIESGIVDGKGNPVSSQAKYANDNQRIAPLHAGAEQIPNDTAAGQTSFKPHPNTPDEPVTVTDRTGKHPITGGNPVLVDLRNQAGKNPYYLDDQTKARAVMDKYVAGNNALEVEKNLPLQLQEETQRIQNIIAQEPKVTSKDNIVKANETNMAKAGITPGNSGKADTATEELLKELQTQISAGSSDVVPNQVNGDQLMTYKKLLDDRLKSVYKKQDNSTTLTPAERATLTLRRTVDQQLTSMYPKTKEALNRQSAMIDARESVAKAAQGEEANQVTQAGLPPKPGFLQSHWKALGALGTLGLAAAPLAGDLAQQFSNKQEQPKGGTENQYNNSPKQSDLKNTIQNNSNDINHDQSVSQNGQNVNGLELDPLKIQPQSDGSWKGQDTTNLKDGNGKSLAMSQQLYDQLKGQITDYMNANPGNDIVQKQGATQLSQLETTFNGGKDIRDNSIKTDQALQSINDAQQMLGNKNASPSFSDAFQLHLGPISTGYQDIHAATNVDYKLLRQQLTTIDTAFPELHLDTQSANSPEAAQKLLAQAAQKIVANQNKIIQSKGGNSVSSNKPGASAVPPGPAAQGNIGTAGGPPPLSPQTGSYQFTAPNPMFK